MSHNGGYCSIWASAKHVPSVVYSLGVVSSAAPYPCSGLRCACRLLQVVLKSGKVGYGGGNWAFMPGLL